MTSNVYLRLLQLPRCSSAGAVVRTGSSSYTGFRQGSEGRGESDCRASPASGACVASPAAEWAEACDHPRSKKNQLALRAGS